MKAFKTIYSHGHFIDVETQQPLVLIQGEEYTITAKDKAFKTTDSKLKLGDPLNSKEKAAWAENEFGNGNYVKILNAREQLFFRVGNSRRVEGDENHQYIFVCNLLEDLFLYRLKGKKGDEEGHWRLAECKCALDRCILGGLTLSEKVPAKSLNALFNNTVQFYFSMQRSAAANAFNTFFLYKPGMRISFQGATNQLYEGLSNLRKQILVTIKQNQ
ncbi:hypothetical protein KJS94_10450 [Flavihumibacter rivuli]|uniref:hypothetical protein n=1 Tax=Flavihumibacter rivuli TaxID=2838156 RepID=UPI001BDED47E|nr:hypothetical protein [Flavihumibacter rivuli]ULQ55059.1 hypothetical protein KJS94_10450 [Flavihumibacter rivuli]